MAAAIRGFSSRSELLRQDQNARARAALVAAVELFDGAPVERQVFSEAVAVAVREVDRRTASHNEGPFIMLYPPQNFLVVEYLSTKSKWPKVATRLWACLFQFVSPVDGEILVTREGLIERVGAQPRAVDGVLAELVKFGALIRRREPEPGKRGRGYVRYFMNPSVGTHLKAGERSAARASAPLLKVIDGAAHPSQRRARAASAPLTVS